MNNPVREFMPFLPDWTAFLMYFIVFLILIIFIVIFDQKRKNYGVGYRELFHELKNAYKNHGSETFQYIKKYVFGQKKVSRMKYSGIMHMFIFYSMILLFIGTFLIFIEQDILKHLGVESIIQGSFYLIYEVILDLSGLFLIAGLLMALYRRLVIKPEYLNSSWLSYFILFSLLYISISGFMIEGIRLTLNPVDWAVFSFVGYGFSLLMKQADIQLLNQIYQWLWWSHFAVVMAFFIVVPLSVLKHIILIPLNLLLSPPRNPKAKMTTPFRLDEMEEDEMDESDDENEEDLQIGIACANDLTWKQKLNLAACINCGRCDSVCPAFASGRELSPRNLVQKIKSTFDHGLRINMVDLNANFFDTGLLTKNEVWSCTNCGACVEECPAMIHHVDYIMDLRRHLVNENKFDDKISNVFSSIDQNYNPLGMPSYKRNEWLVEMDVPLLEDNQNIDYLYWISDLGSYDPRVQSIVKSVIEILNHAEVKFAILTHEEKNCGELLKRMGEEGRYQIIAMENIEVLNNYDVKKILTHDPHTFNMFKNEYPDFGGEYEVIHHSVLIRQLLNENRISISSKQMERIVYHDPCNLSRWNNIFNEPREVLNSVSEYPLLEVTQSKDRTFCCGAGGGNYWYKVPEKNKISNIRLEQLAVVNPETIATGCPYCLMMLEDAVRTSDHDLKVLDIAEIVYQTLNEEK